MNGGDVTIQLPKVDALDPRLQQENSKQNNSALSFEEKLNFEKARLGLLFSPFSQFGSLLAYPQNFSFNPENLENKINLFLNSPPAQSETTKPAHSSNSQLPTPNSTPQIFESMPTQPFNQQVLQELLTKTNWLVPNLSALPLFANAFAVGKLAPTFDLQLLVDQIVKQAQLVKSQAKTELSLTLNSEGLGEIFLTLTSRAGAVAVQILASPETKKLIDAQRSELERALKKAHLQIVAVSIQEVGKNV